MEKIFLEGFFLQASLILALGAQNIFVLESGLQRQYPMVVSLVCFLCDLMLIMLGVIGASALFGHYPFLKIIIGAVGVVFLFQYGVEKIFSKVIGIESSTMRVKNLKKSILLSITFSILNPHAYLDAFILIGGFSAKYQELNYRVVLGLGAACFSGIWFVMLSSASALIRTYLENPLRMKLVMSTAGLVLIFLSGKLSVNVYQWICESMQGTFPLRSVFMYPMPPKGILPL